MGTMTDVRAPGRARYVVGGVALVATLQYLAAEVAAASTWHRGRYGWASDYVSELGSPVCDADGCTPLHTLFSLSLVVHGLLLVAAALLLAPLAGAAAGVVRAGFGLGGLGSVVIGLVPLAPDGEDLVHDVGATLAIAGPTAAAVVLGVWSRPASASPGRRAWGAATLVVAALGVLGGSSLVLGGPPGLAERIGVWPFLAWYVGTGLVVVASTLRGGSPAGRRSTA